MQVPWVTEEVAIAVLDLYPTLLYLAHAYSHLDGDTKAQEEMLRKQSNNTISAVASRNIFQLVWAGQQTTRCGKARKKKGLLMLWFPINK
ncbi:Crossover junction endonuclease mus81, variant 4 [Ancistrocladus abbreviatus]